MTEKNVVESEVLVNLKLNRAYLRMVDTDEVVTSISMDPHAAQDLATQLIEAVRALRRG